MSTLGRIRSLNKTDSMGRPHRGRLIKQRTERGYKMVSLKCRGEQRTRYVHRLVLEAFVGSAPQGAQCCHNNGQRGDNRLENLRWDTPSNNARDRWEHGTMLRGGRHANAVLSAEQVMAIRRRLSHEMGKTLAKEYGVTRAAISRIKHGHNWGWLV